MLKRVLQEVEATNGPIHTAELSRRLGIERSALEGMIAYWVRKGRLMDGEETDQVCSPTAGHCGATCSGTANCAFIARMPRSYTVPRPD
jgi:hypothetical protein